jgi:hypothetical protein
MFELRESLEGKEKEKEKTNQRGYECFPERHGM